MAKARVKHLRDHSALHVQSFLQLPNSLLSSRKLLLKSSGLATNGSDSLSSLAALSLCFPLVQVKQKLLLRSFNGDSLVIKSLSEVGADSSRSTSICGTTVSSSIMASSAITISVESSSY
ncbi:uncharacterized protein G2W53_041366 [Senna tora]|uniref:Uncharacterized protein n=1 Tax=Senna tora TaxID=362788 RepID=A0A834SDL8_9FABA|nr:uncharacterized protein G2W53_041366 [Senna tora]